jgi:hypothetical protein
LPLWLWMAHTQVFVTALQLVKLQLHSFRIGKCCETRRRSEANRSEFQSGTRIADYVIDVMMRFAVISSERISAIREPKRVLFSSR